MRSACWRPRPGFTLLEVILGITLMVGLIAAIYAFYDHAVDTRQRVTQQAQLVSMERLVMDRMTDELRSSIGNSSTNAGMQGTSTDMKFTSAVLPGPAAWAVRKGTEDPVPPEHDIQLVGYRLRIWEDQDGITHNDGLERTCQRILAPKTSATTASDEQLVSSDLIAPAMHFIYLRYFNGSGWSEGYGGGDLPMAVEINLGEKPLPEGMEARDYLASNETFRRVVYLPGNRKSLSGNILLNGPE